MTVVVVQRSGVLEPIMFLAVGFPSRLLAAVALRPLDR
jgi:hypothetical protein